MLANGVEPKAVSSIIGKTVSTIENWFHQYRTKGIDSLNAFQLLNHADQHIDELKTLMVENFEIIAPKA